MKTYLLPSLKLSALLLLLCSVVYPLLVASLAALAPGKGKGETMMVDGAIVGYEHIGQKFSDDRYFQGRPSAVDYNAAGSGASNKAASNPDYLQTVQARIDTFLLHNPGIALAQIPADLVTASGSGLDPNISVAAAQVQVPRIAKLRHLSEQSLMELVNKMTEGPLLGMFGPSKLHVLKLNIALNALSNNRQATAP